IAEGVLEISRERVVYANSAALSIFEIPQEKLLNSNPLDLFDNKTRSKVEENLKSETDDPWEIGIRRPIALKDRLITIKIVPTKKSQPNKIMLVTDVTSRSRMEMELQHARKMESIGTIASGVAHNFRNTLAGILTNSQVVQMNCQDEKLLEIITRINSSVQRGAQLVEKLLEFSYKQITKEFKLLDLVELINDTNQLIQESFDKRINIHVNVSDSLSVLGDQSGLSSVLMNLYNNARNAMPEGGTLSIDAGRQGDRAVIIISDTGRGMDEEILEKCFDPFFTTKEIGKGTGLGLSTAYGIIKSHNGSITVKSGLNEGTVFKIVLPLAMNSEEKLDVLPDETDQIPEIVHGNGEKVLVVDDDIEFLNGLVQLLGVLDYRVASATRGSEAIDTYKTWRPDIVLMDINMPEMDGVTCAQKIFECDPKANIAIMSGYDSYGQYGVKEKEKKLFKGYLTKPIGLNELSRFLSSFHN
ncbi:ATP-binding protein, partial [Thermodesulfobacteriota bacterium]